MSGEICVSCHLAWGLVALSIPVMFTWSVSLEEPAAPLPLKTVSWAQVGENSPRAEDDQLPHLPRPGQPGSRHQALSTLWRWAKSAAQIFCTLSVFQNLCFQPLIACLNGTISMVGHPPCGHHLPGPLWGTTKREACFKPKVLTKCLTLLNTSWFQTKLWMFNLFSGPCHSYLSLGWSKAAWLSFLWGFHMLGRYSYQKKVSPHKLTRKISEAKTHQEFLEGFGNDSTDVLKGYIMTAQAPTAVQGQLRDLAPSREHPEEAMLSWDYWYFLGSTRVWFPHKWGSLLLTLY